MISSLTADGQQPMSSFAHSSQTYFAIDSGCPSRSMVARSPRAMASRISTFTDAVLEASKREASRDRSGSHLYDPGSHCEVPEDHGRHGGRALVNLIHLTTTNPHGRPLRQTDSYRAGLLAIQHSVTLRIIGVAFVPRRRRSCASRGNAATHDFAVMLLVFTQTTMPEVLLPLSERLRELTRH
ncbi:hypothetical protein BD414DRAFT_330226 [Trametes punicea]|nr:hypothetical protein BD414DRAFT_330226 [Trametes punicea]